jgi:hypothetical protein
MADEPNYQPTQESLMGTEEQVPAFAYSEQQARRAKLAHTRIVQELTDVVAQGARLEPDQAAEVQTLLDKASEKASSAPKRGTGK